MIAGAAQNRRLYRWDAATGEQMGEPAGGLGGVVWAVAAAVLPDDTPIFVSGSESGLVCCVNAQTGGLIGEPLRIGESTGSLAVLELLDDRRRLVSADHDGGIHRWDLIAGMPLGDPIGLPGDARIIDARVTLSGVPVVFLDVDEPDDNSCLGTVAYRLDSGERLDLGTLVPHLCAIYDDDGLKMVCDEPDGSTIIRPLHLPGSPETSAPRWA